MGKNPEALLLSDADAGIDLCLGNKRLFNCDPVCGALYCDDSADEWLQKKQIILCLARYRFKSRGFYKKMLDKAARKVLAKPGNERLLQPMRLVLGDTGIRAITATGETLFPPDQYTAHETFEHIFVLPDQILWKKHIDGLAIPKTQVSDLPNALSYLHPFLKSKEVLV